RALGARSRSAEDPRRANRAPRSSADHGHRRGRAADRARPAARGHAGEGDPRVSRSWMPQPIGGQVRRELARYGPAAGMADIVRAWPELVGEEVARNSWPARIARDGTLHVHTSSSAWAFELGQLAPTILGRLRETLPQTSTPALRFAVG